MTKHLRFVLLLASVLYAGLGMAGPEIKGVRLADKVQVGGTELLLNGAGIRTKFLFDIYVCALYLPGKLKNTAEVLAAKGAKRVAMTIVYDEVTAQQFTESLVKRLAENHSASELAQLQARMDKLVAIMALEKVVKKGTAITLDYLPDSGTQLTINGQAKGAVMPGEDFYQALLRGWIGEHPVDNALKKALLNG